MIKLKSETKEKKETKEHSVVIVVYLNKLLEKFK